MPFSILLLLWSGPAHAEGGAVCLVGVANDPQNSQLLELSVRDGVQTRVVDSLAVDLSAVHGLAYDGATVGVGIDGSLSTIDVTTGAVNEEPVSCGTIGGGGGEVILAAGDDAIASTYSSLSSALDVNIGARTTPAIGGPGSVAVDDGVTVSAAPTGSVIQVWDGGGARVFEATGVGAIWGLSLVGGTVYVLDDGTGDDEGTRVAPAVRTFDVSTGALLATYPLTLEPGERARGLACRTSP